MKLPFRKLGFPLLVRELTELSARPRTWLVRVLYAAILYVMMGLFLHESIKLLATDPLSVLGTGWQFVFMMAGMQFIGVYIVMAVLACSAITDEKERNTLTLLQVTRLGPWTIVFEKLLSRLIPITFLILSFLPLLGVAYSLGGATQSVIWAAFWALMLAAIQTASIAIMCSAWAKTTTQAFIATLAFGLFWIIGPMIVGVSLKLSGKWCCINFAPYRLFESGAAGGLQGIAEASFPILLGSLAFLAMARVFLGQYQSAAIRPNRYLAEPRQQREFRNPEVATIGESIAANFQASKYDSLPVDQPIRWRSRSKSVFGNASRITRRIAFLVIVTLVVGALPHLADPQQAQEFFSNAIGVLLWVGVFMSMVARSTSVIIDEYTHETMDVLLATPITNRDILRQKTAPATWMAALLFVPVLTISIQNASWRATRFGGWQNQTMYDGFPVAAYLICVALMYWSWMFFVKWLSVWISMFHRTSQSRALIISLGAGIGVCALPLIATIPWQVNQYGSYDFTQSWFPILQLSPFVLFGVNESQSWNQFVAPRAFAVAVNCGLFVLLAAAIRLQCFRLFGKAIKRGDSSSTTASIQPRVVNRSLINIAEATDQ